MEAVLRNIAHTLRIDVLRMFYQSQTGHLAPALSCIDILTVLYFGGFVRDEYLFTEKRDRVILSKGHACAALYAVLAKKGFFAREELLSFYKRDSKLGGHPSVRLAGIETATGSLGHGICFATGVAKAAKMNREYYKTYVILGDGEMQEGSVWEAAMFGSNHKLDNLTVIVDCNNLQASASVDEIASIGNLSEKWAAFGWNVVNADGHDYRELINALKLHGHGNQKPTVILAQTIKGKGVSLAENNSLWHSRSPKNDEWDMICREYGLTRECLNKL